MTEWQPTRYGPQFDEDDPQIFNGMGEESLGNWVRYDDIKHLLPGGSPLPPERPAQEKSQNEQAWEDLRADGGLPEAQEAAAKFDIGERLHHVLTVHGIASRSDYMSLWSDLIKWAADSCRQSLPRSEPQPPATTTKEKTMRVTTGRTVLYTLTEDDATRINRRRTDSASIAARMKNVDADGNDKPVEWPYGAQAHIGNRASAGDVVPLVVVRVWPNEFGDGVDGVNGQAFLDGNDALWVTSAREGGDAGMWAWPNRA